MFPWRCQGSLPETGRVGRTSGKESEVPRTLGSCVSSKLGVTTLGSSSLQTTTFRMSIVSAGMRYYADTDRRGETKRSRGERRLSRQWATLHTAEKSVGGVLK